MGLRRRDARRVVTTQGIAICLFGLAIGIPLGIVVGRNGWRVITERVPLSDVTPLALTAIFLVIPVTIVITRLLAVWPGWLVSRSRFPSDELRAE
jgi:ABC-type lipoprotein release transport system permease subunit